MTRGRLAGDSPAPKTLRDSESEWDKAHPQQRNFARLPVQFSLP
jgi:hypothetical protein